MNGIKVDKFCLFEDDSVMRDFFSLPGEELEDVVKVIGCFC